MEERSKRYVQMVVRFNTDGRLRPLVVEFDETYHYKIDKILDVRRAVCQSVGGVGDRCTCLIRRSGILSLAGKRAVVRGRQKKYGNRGIKAVWGYAI